MRPRDVEIAWVTDTARHRAIVDPEDEAQRAIDRLEAALQELLEFDADEREPLSTRRL